MKKHLLIAAAAAALLLPVLSSGAYAEPPKQEAGAQWKFSDEDRAALVDASVAGLKAGLKLTPPRRKRTGRRWRPRFANAPRRAPRAGPNGPRSARSMRATTI